MNLKKKQEKLTFLLESECVFQTNKEVKLLREIILSLKIECFHWGVFSI